MDVTQYEGHPGSYLAGAVEILRSICLAWFHGTHDGTHGFHVDHFLRPYKHDTNNLFREIYHKTRQYAVHLRYIWPKRYSILNIYRDPAYVS